MQKALPCMDSFWKGATLLQSMVLLHLTSVNARTLSRERNCHGCTSRSA